VLDYAIPEGFRGGVGVGSRVVVMVLQRRAIGTVLGLHAVSGVPGIRPLEGLVGEDAFLSPIMMKLAGWMASYYCAPMASVMRAMLPPMLRGEKVPAKMIRVVRPAKLPSDADLEVLGKSAPKQQALLRHLRDQVEGTVPVAELLRISGASDSSLRALVRAGWVELSEERAKGDFSGDEILPGRIPELNPDQQTVVEKIHGEIDASGSGGAPAPMLLHGVTGSGKTEVYLRALAKVLEAGKSALVLVQIGRAHV